MNEVGGHMEGAIVGGMEVDVVDGGMEVSVVCMWENVFFFRWLKGF